ncbi:MAG: radical SAM protein [Patescibacteria group bacterium]
MKKIKVEKIPHYVQIETSYACNVSCKFCYNPNRSVPPDLKTLNKIISAVAKAEIPHVQLTGGEPTMLPKDYLNKAIDELSNHSTVTIQTNGVKYIKNLSKNLAKIYLSLHGPAKIHNALQPGGSWKKTINSLENYLRDGFEVCCDFTLTSTNFESFEGIAELVYSMGVKQYTINKYEPAGFGLKSFSKLAPSVKQFKKLVSQVISVQKNTKMTIGFCTAIPFCLDERLAEHGLTSSCGAGISFLSISPTGEVRICNQSDVSYGNVLHEDLIDIWKKKSIDEFRKLTWVTEPCKSCFLFDQCLAGCKVDNSVCSHYCVDHAVRGLKRVPISKSFWQKSVQKYEDKIKTKPDVKFLKKTLITPDVFTKLNLNHETKYLVTRDQTVSLNQTAILVIEKILKGRQTVDEIVTWAKSIDINKDEVTGLLKNLVFIKAITTE